MIPLISGSLARASSASATRSSVDSLSEGKDYGSKVDALVDSMGVTDEKVSPIHRRKDMDLL